METFISIKHCRTLWKRVLFSKHVYVIIIEISINDMCWYHFLWVICKR